MTRSKSRRPLRSLALLAVMFAAASMSACQPAVASPAPGTTLPTAPSTQPAPTATAEPGLPADGPVLLREDITLRQVVETGFGTIKLALDPGSDMLYFLKPVEGIFRLDLSGDARPEKVADISDFTPEGQLAGMKFGPDGTLYVVANMRPSVEFTQAAVYAGRSDASGDFSWETLATTEPYPASNTNFDHLFNGIAVSPDNQWVYLNSGSRTDHGEVQDNEGFFPDLREVPITSAILRIPVQAVDLQIPNDEAALLEQGLLFADGTRNAYDLEFAPNGDLFGVDNGPDADYPDELNWIRQGFHYGFPWRFGEADNPQQFADYDPSQDLRLSEDFAAVQTETYRNDPGFPAAPPALADPVINLGPDAALYRDDQGQERNAAAEGEALLTFTPHRSPLGLAFATDASLPADLRPAEGGLSLFVLSWGAAGGDLGDQGQDLLHLSLTKQGDNYVAVTHQIARDFKRPIDAVMIANRLYVLEWDGEGVIWELTFQ